jgi:hypothetical protein
MADLPRIPYEKLPPQLKDELRAKVERLGYLGEFFQIGAHQPEALYHFNRFTETLKKALPDNIVELLALTLSCWSGNDYERVQHERLALKMDLSREWVLDVERLAPDSAAHLSDMEKAVQRLALAVAKSQGRDAKAEADSFLALAGPERTMAVMMTIARYLAHSAICNTFKFAPPVASPFA